MVTIYVDVLLGLNWFVNFFLLLGVSKIGKTPLGFKRNILASFVLALGSLCIFLPPFSAVIECGMRLLGAMIGVFIAFGFHSFSAFLKSTGMFFAATFVYGGIVLGLWYVFHPKGVIIHNGVTYINLSPVMLVIFTVIAYGILWLIRKNFAKESAFKPFVTLHIQQNQKTVTVQAKVDTGFVLEDMYTGYPLILLSPKIGKTLKLNAVEQFRLLPYETVNGSGLVKTVTGENLVAQQGTKTATFPLVSLALGERDFHDSFEALVGYDFIERLEQQYEISANPLWENKESVFRKTNRLYQRLGNLAVTFKKGRRTTVNGTAEKRR